MRPVWTMVREMSSALRLSIRPLYRDDLKWTAPRFALTR
jgi:hypothetical protein